jgi:hypothetical protein
MMHPELYCKNLDSLEPIKAIRAIHQAYLQLRALTENVDCEHYDNQPALTELEDCLRMAGHIGFTGS